MKYRSYFLTNKRKFIKIDDHFVKYRNQMQETRIIILQSNHESYFKMQVCGAFMLTQIY